jgi:hypothetical protein
VAMKTPWFFAVFAGFLSLWLAGCGSKPEPGQPLGDLLDSLTSDPIRAARLDSPPTRFESSYDRRGGNDDHNWFPHQNPDGWAILADLRGPGLLTRFWCTGGLRPERRLRFFFDGEKTPRIDRTLAEILSGAYPFPTPLARWEEKCFLSYVPMPFAERLVIMVDDWEYTTGKRKFFHQLNWRPLTNAPVSLPGAPEEESARALRRFAEDFVTAPRAGSAPGASAAEATISPGSEALLAELAGPFVLREIRLTAEDLSPAMLRDAVLEIAWNGAAQPSVRVPLGDFFGSVWGRVRYQSRYFGLEEETFVSRFPMPFEHSARLVLRNEGDAPLRVSLEVRGDPVDSWDPDWGLFHAVWNRSGPAPGRPHAILDAEGRGKYVGCILAAVSRDKSWWLLESDEMMFRDGETRPFWHGTGLEDYFNAGWYYENAFVRPLHGLVFKAPFRTVQYRLHDLDAVPFDESLRVLMERGPRNESRGVFESVAFYYLDRPRGVELADERDPPEMPLARYTLMTELANLERLGDYRAASEAVERWMTTHPDDPGIPMLALRRIAYVERMEGFAAAEPLYREFIESTESALAKRNAELLVWFHERPTHALALLYSKNPSRLSIDGKPVLQGGNPQRLAVAPVELRPGPHAVSVEARRIGYPDWIQACVRTHGGLIGTGSDWRTSFRPEQQSKRPGFDDSGWAVVGDALHEGPPPIPHVAMDAHPFVDMHSRAAAVWTSEPWPDGVSQALFREEFWIDGE